MLAVLLAVVTAISYGGSDYAGGLAVRQTSVIRVTVVAEVTNAVVLISIVPFVSDRAPSLGSVIWGATAGAGGVAGAMALFLGFRHAAFSVASSVSAVATAAFSVMAGLVFGERPDALSLAGMALAVLAIVGVSMSTRRAKMDEDGGSGVVAVNTAMDGPGDPADRPSLRAPGRHAAGVIWGLTAGAGFGLFLIGLNRAGSPTDLWPLAVAGLVAVLTVTPIAASTRQLGLPPAGTRWLSVLTGVTAAAGTLAYFLATHQGLLAVTGVISSLYPAVTILLARTLSGERLTAFRIIGLLFAAASVSLIAAGGAI
jgi:drug/metabolite transporter (DMT)-like permease